MSELKRLDILALRLTAAVLIENLRSSSARQDIIIDRVDRKEVETTFIELFCEIRDFPFDLTRPKRKMGYEGLVIDTRRRRRGSCSTKHYLLGRELQTLGIEARYITVPFCWQDQTFDYPEHLWELAERMPVQYHLALEAVFDARAYLLDATWDPPLKMAGFPVNFLTTEMRSGVMAVDPCGEPIVHWDGVERWKYIEALKLTMFSTGVEPTFYQSLNEWLETLRDG